MKSQLMKLAVVGKCTTLDADSLTLLASVHIGAVFVSMQNSNASGHVLEERCGENLAGPGGGKPGGGLASGRRAR